MTTTFEAWSRGVLGRYVDADKAWGPQCWDLIQDGMDAFGLGPFYTETGAPNFHGFAAGAVEGFGQNGLERVFTLHDGRTERGQPTDVVVWSFGNPSYEKSHTAWLTGPDDGASDLDVLSQNSSNPDPAAPGYPGAQKLAKTYTTGPVRRQRLPREECWFLRPINPLPRENGGAAVPATIETLTQFTSPNQSPRSFYGYGPKPTAITHHWWGLPEWNATFMGTVSYLCRAGGNTSAHVVISGYRRAIIVNYEAASWACGSTEGNGRSVSFEIDPKLPEGTLETVAQTAADIERFYGPQQHFGHRDWTETTCPGTIYEQIGWIINRTNAILGGAPVATPKPPAAAAKPVAPSPTNRRPASGDRPEVYATPARSRQINKLIKNAVYTIIGWTSGEATSTPGRDNMWLKVSWGPDKTGWVHHSAIVGGSNKVGLLALATSQIDPNGPAWVVEAGNTLNWVAARYGVSAQQISTYNGLADPAKISVGQKLYIPGPLEWHVDAGDTLAKVDDHYGYAPGTVAARNGLAPGATLQVGQVLDVYS